MDENVRAREALVAVLQKQQLSKLRLDRPLEQRVKRDVVELARDDRQRLGV